MAKKFGETGIKNLLSALGSVFLKPNCKSGFTPRFIVKPLSGSR